MKGLWTRSSRCNDDDWTPIAGETPTEIAANYAKTINTEGMAESELLGAMIEDAENWSDNPAEQAEYLLSLKHSFGL